MNEIKQRLEELNKEIEKIVNENVEFVGYQNQEFICRITSEKGLFLESKKSERKGFIEGVLLMIEDELKILNRIKEKIVYVENEYIYEKIDDEIKELTELKTFLEGQK